MNRFLTKGMSNIYIKVLLRQTDVLKLQFVKFKKFVIRSVFGKLQPTQISLNFKTSFKTSFSFRLQPKNERSESKTVLCYCFNFEKSLDVLKWKCRCILLNKNINFNKNKTGSKWKILHTVLERPTLSFSSYTNRKLKLKLWWVGAHERKVRAFLYFFYRLFCPKEFFFFQHLCFISMYSVLNTLSKYTYFYISKNVISKSSKAF